jgi:CheY-specific phosphatase CheX
MNEPLDPILFDVVCRTFEDLAFMFPMGEEEAAGVLPAKTVSASVAFAGPFDGRMVVVVDRLMLASLAANMLGLDPGVEPTPAQQEDALKELANVICGNLLPKVAGEDAVFQVLAPTLSANDALAAASDAPTAVAHVTLDSGAASVALYASRRRIGEAVAPATGPGAHG